MSDRVNIFHDIGRTAAAVHVYIFMASLERILENEI